MYTLIFFISFFKLKQYIKYTIPLYLFADPILFIVCVCVCKNGLAVHSQTYSRKEDSQSHPKVRDSNTSDHSTASKM